MEAFKKVSQFGHALMQWLRPEPTGDTPLTMADANSLLERGRLTELLQYRDFVKDKNLVLLDDGVGLSAGFALHLNPLLIAGLDAESQMEAVINAFPSNSVVQFAVMATPQVGGLLDTWAKSRLSTSKSDMLRELTLRRHEFFEAASSGKISLTAADKIHPMLLHYFVLGRVPFTGDYEKEEDLELFLRTAAEVRDTVHGALAGARISSRALEEAEVKWLLRELLNPRISPRERMALATDAPLREDLIEREQRIRVTPEGYIGFSAQAEDKDEILMSAMTVDWYPDQLYLPIFSTLLGSLLAREDHITVPFWAYTTIHVLDPDSALERLTAKLGALNKQSMSESPWYKSMMSHLFEQRDSVMGLIKAANAGHPLVRAYSGINLYGTAMNVRQATEYVKGLWRRAGVRASQEKYIALPTFLASLPMHYTPAMDPPGKGLQRAMTMHSANAAALAFVQGDWSGSDPHKGGPLLISRRGHIASMDLFDTQTNFNFVVVAESGAGKSYFCNDLSVDFLTRNGVVRIIDAGASYYRQCTTLGGQNLVFDPNDPLSMNPFTGVEDEADLRELMPMIKSLLRQMAYPLQPEVDTPAWEYAAIEAAVTAAWQEKRGATELADVYNWLMAQTDERAQDLAFQLAPYAIGRYAPWFSGVREVKFENDFIVIELDHLKSDPELQAVVLSLCISQITKDLYLSGRERPKLLLVDEAWQLLAGVQTGKFIETAFRTIRKHNGIAGVITQTFMDFDKSPAAQAAIANAAWQFVLSQKDDSLQYARKQGYLSDDDMLKILRTVKSGNGFSEVYVKSETGQGVYRLITDRHAYYTFTTRATDIVKIDNLREQGLSLEDAVDHLAREDYQKFWGGWTPKSREELYTGEVQ